MTIDNRIFDFCYENALRDAALRSAFTGSLQDIRDMTDLKRNVKEYTDILFDSAVPVPDTTNVLNLISELDEVKEYNNGKNGSKCIKFGNIQKLVNMTVKYLYIANYKCMNEDKLKRFDKCHCPIDSRILGKVVELAEGLDNEIIKEWNKRMREKGINRNSIITMARNISFSNIKKTEYDLLQEIIIDMVKNDSDVNNAIEFDYKYWQ